MQTGRPGIAPVYDLGEVRATRPGADHPLLDQYPVHSVIGVPLRAGGTLVGAGMLSRGTPGRPYSAADLAILEDLSDRAGLALENARLYRELQAAVRARDDLIAI